jgi:hypothetical protein
MVGIRVGDGILICAPVVGNTESYGWDGLALDITHHNVESL